MHTQSQSPKKYSDPIFQGSDPATTHTTTAVYILWPSIRPKIEDPQTRLYPRRPWDDETEIEDPPKQTKHTVKLSFHHRDSIHHQVTMI